MNKNLLMSDINLLKSEIEYFKKLKIALGDLHGHIHSLTVKVAHLHLREKFPKITRWETSETYGEGIDIIGRNSEGTPVVVAEVKTTFRSKKETLGSHQRTKIREDINKLISSDASNKYLFVIDDRNKKSIEAIFRRYENSGIVLENIFD